MKIYNPKVGVVGLGYVGLPVALAMAEKFSTVGFDAKSQRIEELARHYDRNGTATAEELQTSSVDLTSSVADLASCNFYIVAVPTPVDSANVPDLNALSRASIGLSPLLKAGDIVVFESTVYPGATEEVCVPLLEKHSTFKAGRDFFVGYSPERINPGDLQRGFKDICKVVSAQNEETLAKVAFVYESVVKAGVFKASSIRVAEAAKVIENTQRDLNIALMNELSVIFERMNIDTLEVLKAASTKWNFLPFVPGLVGGHCIGVDPYYLTHKAQILGYHPEVILAGRRINDSMGRYIADRTIQAMAMRGGICGGDRVSILGLSFKENCPDVRNSKVYDVIKRFQDYNLEVSVCDPWVIPEEAGEEFGLKLTPLNDLKPAKAVVVAVAHREFRDLPPDTIKPLVAPGGVLFDVKGIWPNGALREYGLEVIRL